MLPALVRTTFKMNSGSLEPLKLLSYVKSKQNSDGDRKSTETPRTSYTISRVPVLTEQNRPGLKRMIDIYFSGDPIASAFKINQGRTVSSVLYNFLLQPINQGMSFVATDNNTNEIIGLIINHICDSDGGVENLLREVENDREKELVRFWNTLANEPQHLKHKPVYNIEYNIVDPRYRKSGIALEMGKKALQLGNEMKVKYVRSECSNAYTCLIADQMGYTREFSIAYQDVLDSKGNRVFTDIRPPHTHFHIYILYMELAKTKPYL